MHMCAVVIPGDVYCWGYNKYGQLGTGNNFSSFEPLAARVDGLTGGNLAGFCSTLRNSLNIEIFPRNIACESKCVALSQLDLGDHQALITHATKGLLPPTIPKPSLDANWKCHC